MEALDLAQRELYPHNASGSDDVRVVWGLESEQGLMPTRRRVLLTPQLLPPEPETAPTPDVAALEEEEKEPPSLGSTMRRAGSLLQPEGEGEDEDIGATLARRLGATIRDVTEFVAMEMPEEGEGEMGEEEAAALMALRGEGEGAGVDDKEEGEEEADGPSPGGIGRRQSSTRRRPQGQEASMTGPAVTAEEVRAATQPPSFPTASPATLSPPRPNKPPRPPPPSEQQQQSSSTPVTTPGSSPARRRLPHKRRQRQEEDEEEQEEAINVLGPPPIVRMGLRTRGDRTLEGQEEENGEEGEGGAEVLLREGGVSLVTPRRAYRGELVLTRTSLYFLRVCGLGWKNGVLCVIDDDRRPSMRCTVVVVVSVRGHTCNTRQHSLPTIHQAFSEQPEQQQGQQPPAISRHRSLGGPGGIGEEREDGEGPGRRRWLLGNVSGVYLRRCVACIV